MSTAATPAGSGETGSPIRIGQSCLPDVPGAVRELHDAVVQPDMALLIFFCSSEYDLGAMAAEIGRAFPGVLVAGCTDSGEIGPAGCREGSLVGVSFSGASFAAQSVCLDNLATFESLSADLAVQEVLRTLEVQRPEADETNTFALMFIDGLSVREEIVANALQHALGKIPLVGGSAGESQEAEIGTTSVYHAGGFASDRCSLTLISTHLPFRVFQTQHFIPGTERVVVTGATSETRVVSEINGLPAAQEYARLVGVAEEELSPKMFAGSPVVVMMGGTNYVRSIREVRPDESLVFYCAVEKGMVLRCAHGRDLVSNLRGVLEGVRKEIGPPLLTLVADCVLRKVEMVRDDIVGAVEDVYRENRTVGFNSYGEQYCGVHVNQTLTGVAIGSASQE